MQVRIPIAELHAGEYVVRVGKREIGGRYLALETVEAGRIVSGPRGGAYRLTAAGAAAYRVLVTTRGRPLVDASAVAVVERDEETRTARTSPPPAPVPAAPQPAREVDWLAARNRQQFPAGCGLCGEPADAEMGEFWQPKQERGVVAHAQCGVDAEMELA